MAYSVAWSTRACQDSHRSRVLPRAVGRLDGPAHPRERAADGVEEPVALAGPGGAPEPGHGLAHLGPVEEPGGAADDVGDAAPREGVLVGLGLGVDPEQHRDLAERAALVAQPGDPRRDRLGLGDLVGLGGVGDRRARGPLGAQLDPPAGGLLQQRVGGRDDLGGRAVVADQLDRGGAGELRREVAQVGSVGAREGVDRLGRVAHDAQLVAAPQPQVEQRRLDRRDVLELVDHEPFVLAADLGGHALVLGEHPRGEQQDVLHVHPPLAALDVLVGAEDAGHRVAVVAGDRAAPCGRDAGVVVGVDVADLGPLDLGGEVAQQRLVAVEPLAPGGAGEQTDLGVDERRQLAAVHVRPEVAQLAQRRGVEGARLHAPGAEHPEPAAHLPRGAGGEGDGQDLGRRVDPGGDAVRDPVRDRAGLAGPGAGQDPHRPAQRLGDPALLRVEGREEVVGGGRHGGNNSSIAAV